MRMMCLVVVIAVSLVGGCKKKAVSRVDPSDVNGRADSVLTANPGDVLKVIPSARPALPAGWSEFRHPEGAYTVYVPGPMFPPKTSNSRLNQPVPRGSALRSKFGMRLPVSSPGIPYCEVEVVAFSPELVDGSRAAMERESHILAPVNPTKTAVTWAGRPAIEEIDEQIGGGGVPTKYVHRWMFVGNRLYAAAIWGLNGHPTPEERSAFFDSLVVGK